MEIVINGTENEYVKTFSFDSLDNFEETFKKISSIKGPIEAKFFVINDSLSSHQLSKFKNFFEKNICLLCIYSNNRKQY